MFLLSPPQGRYLLRYSPTTETLVLEKDAILSDDHLKSLDKSLAPYPFHAMEGWKKLSNRIGEQTLRRVLGEEWKVDGLTRVDGEVDEVDIPQRPVEGGDGGPERPKHQVEEPPLRFTLFDPKRSWREGAIGEEVTRYSKDKSWLLGDVLNRLHHGEAFSGRHHNYM
jgi:A1 cistron-splicing factor AAR2